MRELLGKQVDLYGRIERLSLAQRGCIEGEDTRPLLGLLSDRQRLTVALTDLNAELAPYRARWDQVKATLLDGERSEIERLFAQVRECLRRILDGDESDVRLLAAKRDSTAGRLRGLDAARQTLTAYGKGASAAAGMLEGTEA
jgi:hypothetical protein